MSEQEKTSTDGVQTVGRYIIQQYPIGRIDWITTNGDVLNSEEAMSSVGLEADIKWANKNYHDMPTEIIFYKDKDGNPIPDKVLSSLVAPPQSIRYIDSPYLENPKSSFDIAREIIKDKNGNPLPQNEVLSSLVALPQGIRDLENPKFSPDIERELIIVYFHKEFRRVDGADFILSEIDVAYTTAEDDKHEIQAKVNLVDFQIEIFVDGKVINEQFSTLEDMIERGIKNLSLDNLVYLSEKNFTSVSRERNRAKHRAFYSDEKVKAIPIAEVLENMYGIRTVKKGDRLWCSLRNSDDTLSCCIYPNNSWFDFGDSNRGGDVIALVQTLEQCDWYSALCRLGEAYHIMPQDMEITSDNSLSEREWMQLGLHPDMATKNMDIDVERFGVQVAMTSASKYRMSMNELRSADPQQYHRILKDRVLRSLKADCDGYYSSLLSDFELRKSIGGVDFAHAEIDKTRYAEAEKINKDFQLLRRAVDDKSAVPVPKTNLSPPSDLSDILNGKIQFQTQGMPYFELLGQAYQSKEPVFFVQLSHEKSMGLMYENRHIFSAVSYSLFFKNGVDTLCVFGRDLSRIRRAFGEEILSVTQRSSSKSREVNRQYPTRNLQKRAPDMTVK